MGKTKEIRLEWEADSYTFDDYTVPVELDNDTIQNAIDLALAYHQDESGNFVRILAKQGYDVKLILEKDKEVFNFNIAENEEYSKLSEEQLNEIVKLKSKIDDKIKKSSKTREIRLEWEADGYTFDDYIVTENLSQGAIQEAIDMALAYNQDESGEFVRILEGRGYKVNLKTNKDKIVFDFNTPENEDYMELSDNELDDLISKLKNTNNTPITKKI